MFFILLSFQDIIFNIDPLSIATGSSESVIFDTRKLAAIRSGKWKLMTGVVGFNGIVPHPVRDISSCKFLQNIVSDSYSYFPVPYIFIYIMSVNAP